MYLLMYLDYILPFFPLFKSFLPLLTSESHFFFFFLQRSPSDSGRLYLLSRLCVLGLARHSSLYIYSICLLYSFLFFLKNILLKVSQLIMEQSKFDANLSNQPRLLVKHLKYLGQDRTLRSYFCHYIKKINKKERDRHNQAVPCPGTWGGSPGFCYLRHLRGQAP